MIEDEDEPPIKVPKIEPLLYIEQCKISTMIICCNRIPHLKK
jgi:hypothetical protein